MRWVVIPASVPLSGFLSLSAVSWQTRASRPCFVPQPFLGSSLQSVPLARISAPLSRPLASWRLSTDVLDRVDQDLSPPVSVTHTLARACQLSPTTMSSLSARRSALPGHSGSRTTEPIRSVRFTRFEASIPPRVRSHQPELPLTSGRSSLGFSAPPELSPSTPWFLRPVQARDLNTRRHPKATTRDSRDLAAPFAG